MFFFFVIGFPLWDHNSIIKYLLFAFPHTSQSICCVLSLILCNYATCYFSFCDSYVRLTTTRRFHDRIAKMTFLAWVLTSIDFISFRFIFIFSLFLILNFEVLIFLFAANWISKLPLFLFSGGHLIIPVFYSIKFLNCLEFFRRGHWSHSFLWFWRWEIPIRTSSRCTLNCFRSCSSRSWAYCISPFFLPSFVFYFFCRWISTIFIIGWPFFLLFPYSIWKWPLTWCWIQNFR